MKITLAILALLAFVGAASAECCPTDKIGRCGDYTIGTPCCGYGKCNIFCCNCDGGCRHPDHSKRSRNLIALDRFGEIDANNDNNIDLEEFTKYQQPDLLKAERAEKALFNSVDRDGDGLISIREMDEDLAKEQRKTAN